MILNTYLMLAIFDGPRMIPGQNTNLSDGQAWLTTVVAAISAIVAISFTIRVLYSSFTDIKRARTNLQEQHVRIVNLEKKTEEEPEKVRYAWDLARIKLEAYFDRNLNQVKAIFYVAVVVMLGGFALIGWGIHEAVQNNDKIKIAMIASASGIITQFIGLTFMVIYKSTMAQAGQFMTVLERINTVGMAVQILDSMDDSISNLRDVTRVDIIRLLLATPGTKVKFSPRTRKGDRAAFGDDDNNRPPSPPRASYG